MEKVDRHMASQYFDEAFETHKWALEIPVIKFPPHWEVKIIPPFGGALVRFRVNDAVSVYLDGYNLLGVEGKPYWEVYLYDTGYVFRCDMNDVDGLLKAINESITENL